MRFLIWVPLQILIGARLRTRLLFNDFLSGQLLHARRLLLSLIALWIFDIRQSLGSFAGPLRGDFFGLNARQIFIQPL